MPHFLGRMAPSLYLTGKSVWVLSTIRECLGAVGLMVLTTAGSRSVSERGSRSASSAQLSVACRLDGAGFHFPAGLSGLLGELCVGKNEGASSISDLGSEHLRFGC